MLILEIKDPKVAGSLNKGAVVVLPTDTVYGICAKANTPEAVAKLYKLKNRQSKPGTIIAASINQLVDLGIKRRYLTPVMDYWPGPISIEIPHNIDYLNQKTGRQALRVVAEPKLAKLLEKTGPLVTSSCNLPGQPEAINIDQAKRYFGDKIELYVDGGDLSDRKPSTLIRIIDDAVEVVREGAVKISESGEIIK